MTSDRSATHSLNAVMRGIGSVLDIGATGARPREGTIQHAWSRVARSMRAASRQNQEDEKSNPDYATLHETAFRLWEMQTEKLVRAWVVFEDSEEWNLSRLPTNLRYYPGQGALPRPYYFYSLGFVSRSAIAFPIGYPFTLEEVQSLQRVVLEDLQIVSQLDAPPRRYMTYLIELNKTLQLEVVLSSTLPDFRALWLGGSAGGNS